MSIKMVDLPSQEEMVKNVVYTFLNASPEDMQEGMVWYEEAYRECSRIAQKYGISTTTVVALVAVISPSIMWGGNISAPEKIIDLWQNGVPASEWVGFNIYPANLLKAERILSGDLTVMRGNKVKSFYANILGDPEPITIDRWSIRVALNDPKLGKDMIVPSGKKVYNYLGDVYRESGRLLRTEGMDVQAVTWTVFRNKYNGKVRKAKQDSVVGTLVMV